MKLSAVLLTLALTFSPFQNVEAQELATPAKRVISINPQSRNYSDQRYKNFQECHSALSTKRVIPFVHSLSKISRPKLPDIYSIATPQNDSFLHLVTIKGIFKVDMSSVDRFFEKDGNGNPAPMKQVYLDVDGDFYDGAILKSNEGILFQPTGERYAGAWPESVITSDASGDYSQIFEAMFNRTLDNGIQWLNSTQVYKNEASQAQLEKQLNDVFCTCGKKLANMTEEQFYQHLSKLPKQFVDDYKQRKVIRCAALVGLMETDAAELQISSLLK